MFLFDYNIVMKTKHIIFTDIDGTLYSSKNNFHPDLDIAIEAVKQHEDLELAVCTGNGMFDQVKSVAKKIGARYIIASNGSTIYDNELGEYLNIEYIDVETTKKVIGFLVDNNKLFHSWDLDSVYTNEFTKIRRDRIKTFLGETVDIKDEQNIEGRLLSIIKFGEPSSVDEVHDFISDLDIKGIKSREDFMEIIPLRSNKGFAVEWLSNHLGVPLENTASIGDSMNDVPMFKVTGKSYAVGNAREGVAEFTTNQVAHVDQNGAGEAILDLIKYWYN